jgi:hypothetical protein
MEINYLFSQFPSETITDYNQRIKMGIFYEPSSPLNIFTIKENIGKNITTNENFYISFRDKEVEIESERNYILYSGNIKLFSNEYYYFHGPGKEFRKNGFLKYFGMWKKGLYHGYGIEYFFYHDGKDIKKYDGFFHKGNYHGHGKLFNLENVKIFEGEFKHGRRHGYGKIFDENGKIQFEGNFMNDKKNGFGIEYTLNNNSEPIFKYKGMFKNNKYEGLGSIYCLCEKINIKGVFKENRLHGSAILYDCHGFQIFNGNFSRGKIHGNGRYFHKQSEKVQTDGKFKHGNNGKVTEYDINSKIIYQGQWINGKRHGRGSLYLKNGLVKTGTFRDGHYFDPDDIDRMKIRQFLETGDETKILKVKTRLLLHELQKFQVSASNRKTIISKLIYNYQKEQQNSYQDYEYDLFGNKIEIPCIGNDGATYDMKSVSYLFKKKNNSFVNIPYKYNNKNQRVPNFPIMQNGKELSGFYCPSLDYKFSSHEI